MQFRLAILLLGVLSLTACQSVPGGISTPITPPNLTAETCKQLVESYMQDMKSKKSEAEVVEASPKLAEYGKKLHECQEKGLLTEKDMMQAMQNVAQKEEMTPDVEATEPESIPAAQIDHE